MTTELAQSVTISRDHRIWINGRLAGYYLDPQGPAVVQGSQPGARVLALPILLSPDAIVVDLRDDVP